MTIAIEAPTTPDDASELVPGIQITTVPAADRKMEDLFSIDGVTYQIPARVGANITLGYLRLARTNGDAAAIGWAAEKVLGEKAYTALMECDDLTQDDMDAVFAVVHVKIMGAMEAGKGKGPRG
jgi:hypothetical protein